MILVVRKILTSRKQRSNPKQLQQNHLESQAVVAHAKAVEPLAAAEAFHIIPGDSVKPALFFHQPKGMSIDFNNCIYQKR